MSQYGQTEYGQEPYGNNTSQTGIPTIQNRVPVSGAVGVAVDTTISFDIVDWNRDLLPASVTVNVDGVTVYQNETDLLGFVVTRSPLSYGFHYHIVAPSTFAYQKRIMVFVVASDATGHTTISDWPFTTERSSGCFDGTLNTFETSLLDPYTNAAEALYFTEQLRKVLLENAVDTPNPAEAIRYLFLRAHATELGTVLRDIVPTPTAAEATVRLCYKRTLLEVATSLQGKPGLLDSAIQELPSLGLPLMHLQLLISYANTNDPNVRVPLAALLLFLAKSLENNELV